ncbi:MAG: hypothetical protein ACREXU_10750 [Gammaproteobacteria bacterium]
MSEQAMVRQTETAPSSSVVQRRTRPGIGAVVEAVTGGLKGELSATDLGQLVRAVWTAGRRAATPPTSAGAIHAERPPTTPAGIVAAWTLPIQGDARVVLEDRRAWCTAVRLLVGSPIAGQILSPALRLEVQAHLRTGRPPRQREP